ncbi:Monoacylglycerol lipase [Alphaproteobacteria bacterium SO-S41]|nr:Monoacylglycerol lipase [Alphaproteobacteria bacterium SO-S41]
MAIATTEETIPGSGELKLHVRSWRPDGPPRAVVAICPGFNAHSGQYAWVAEQFAASGLAVYAVDLRGRGKSDGERFYVDTVDDYVSDLHACILFAKSREPGLPVFLLGHSAGGVTSCVYALEHQSEIKGLICESFAFQIPAPDFALAVLKGISHLFPHAHVLRLKNEDFSRDPAWVKHLNEDPLIDHETQPTKTVAALARADERLKTGFPQITLPVLILHGKKDKATKWQGSQFFHDHAGSTDKTLKLYEDHVHDPLADLGKESVMADIQAWLDARI